MLVSSTQVPIDPPPVKFRSHVKTFLAGLYQHPSFMDVSKILDFKNGQYEVEKLQPPQLELFS